VVRYEDVKGFRVKLSMVNVVLMWSQYCAPIVDREIFFTLERMYESVS